MRFETSREVFFLLTRSHVFAVPFGEKACAGNRTGARTVLCLRKVYGKDEMPLPTPIFEVEKTFRPRSRICKTAYQWWFNTVSNV